MAKKKKPAEATELTKTEKKVIDKSSIEAINKEFGENKLMTLDSAPLTSECPWQISTGSIGLDIAIGPIRRMKDGTWMTGIPPARMVEIFGEESTGKTTIALQSVASAQRRFRKLGLEIAYVDMEHAVDADYARALKVDTKRLRFTQPDSGDQAMEIIDRLLGTRQYGLIVIDSVASLIPQEVLSGNITDDHIGLQARLMSQSLSKFSSLLGSTGSCQTVLMFTNQVRSKIGFGANGGTTTPGGRALRFYANLRINVGKGTEIVTNPEVKDFRDKVHVGFKMWGTTVKNKGFPPFRRFESPLFFGHGIDRTGELAELAKAYGAVEVSGSWYRHPCGLNANGIGAFVEQVRNNMHKFGVPIYDSLMTNIMASRGQAPDGSYLPGFVPPDTSDAAYEDETDFAMQSREPAVAPEAP